MAGDRLLAKTGADLEPGDYLFVPSAERAFPVVGVKPAYYPGGILVTLETSSGAHWTLPVDADESCACEVLS